MAKINKVVEETLKKKAKKAGMPLRIIKKVFARGQAAWLTGSRPGFSMNAWAMARVNSFIRGSKKHDTDLRKELRG